MGVVGNDSTNDEFVQIRIPADTPPGRYCIAARWDWQQLRGRGRVPTTTYLRGPANLVVRDASSGQTGGVTLYEPESSSDSSEYRQPGQPISAVETNPSEYTMWVENTQRGDNACNEMHAQPGAVLTITRQTVRSVLTEIRRD
ncbi:hypothetical protein MNBD_GAMMA09-1774 [hydrothermal vent metagenome]|uniref:Uncharacterized protein n=1 Tax=hydrothermal vent metagenome TaxID=652676 RepID=A0A3B0XKI3_9ZZZZ